MWKFRYPILQEDESEEEYQQRCEAYEAAEDDYADRYVEERYEREHSQE